MAYTKQQNQIKKALLEKGFTSAKLNKYGQWDVEYRKSYPNDDSSFNELPIIAEWIKEVCPNFKRIHSGIIISPMATKVKGLSYTFELD